MYFTNKFRKTYLFTLKLDKKGEAKTITKGKFRIQGKYSITVVYARKVGEVIKYLTEKDAESQISYSFYM